MKICDLISELQRYNPQDEIGVEVAPEDLHCSDLVGKHPEPDVFGVHTVERNNGGNSITAKIILIPA